MNDLNNLNVIGKIPKTLIDTYVRQHRLTDRAFGKIGDFVLSFAMRSGYEILDSGAGILSIEEDNFFAVFVRSKDAKEVVGFLVVDEGGDIRFVEIPEPNASHGSSSDVLYG